MLEPILSSTNLFMILATASTMGSLFRHGTFPEIQQTSIDQNKPIYVSQAVLPLPENGTVTRYLKVSTNQTLAPFKVITSSNAFGQNYFIKLANWSNNKTILTLFIRNGQTASVDVPLGVYKIKVASGKDWYGINHAFGPNTDWSVIENRFGDSKFTFEIRGDQVFGRALKLYNVPNGNVNIKQILLSDF